jgi:phenylpropionate dioxygenase-like ring-hydroxylating dioxygenase large terminal subunit
MTIAEQIDGQTTPGLPPSHYLDNRIYTDPEIFALERDHIFARCWKFVCHASELRAPGDYRLVTVAGQEIILLRGPDGGLRAFLNSCAHRGARLLRAPAGQIGDRITCFYHLWSYDPNGRCVVIPEPAAFEKHDLSRASVGLRPVRLETLFDLVFVCLDNAAGPLVDFLGAELIEALRTPFGSAELEVFHFHRAEIQANWKLFVETNYDGYHELLHTLNRTTAVAVKEYRARRWRAYPGGHASLDQAVISYGRLKYEVRDEHTLPGMQPSGHAVVDVFPDLHLNCRATVVRVDALVPLDPHRTLVECRGLGLKGDGDAVRRLRIRHHNQVWGPTGTNLAEDIWAVEAQMTNIASGASRYGIIAREEEGSMDDAPMRGFYAEWGRRTGRRPHHATDAA